MRIWLVLESASAHEIIRALLPPAILEQFAIVPIGGRTNLSSAGRTLLVKHREPVAVLAETHSLDAGVIHERYTTLDYLLRAVAGGVPCKVILAIPELEVVFFEIPETLARLFPAVDLSMYLTLYKTQPREALTFLFKHGGGPTSLAALLEAVTEDDIESLRRAGPIGELTTFAAAAATQPH